MRDPRTTCASVVRGEAGARAPCRITKGAWLSACTEHAPFGAAAHQQARRAQRPHRLGATPFTGQEPFRTQTSTRRQKEEGKCR